jgi:hypothetical protein
VYLHYGWQVVTKGLWSYHEKWEGALSVLALQENCETECADKLTTIAGAGGALLPT